MSLNVVHTADCQFKSVNKVAILTLFVVCMISFMPAKLLCQNVSEPISFSVRNTTLDRALEKLYTDFQVNVAFSKAELSKIDIDHYSAKNKSIDVILGELLEESGYTYKRIGNQYVVRKSKKTVPVEEDPEEKEPLQRQVDTFRVVDTVVKIKTVLKHDTIVNYETIVRHDTVFFVKRFWNQGKNYKANGWFLNGSVESGNGHFSTSSSDPSYDALYALQDSAVNLHPFSVFGMYFGAGRKNDRFTVGASLSYKSVKYRFAMDRAIGHQAYYLQDTLDTYYVINPSGTDTAYFYVIDSTYQPEQWTIYSYRDLNRLSYLGLDVYASYDIVSHNVWRLFATVGATTDFLVSASGSVFSAEAPYYNKDLGNEIAPIKCSLYLGVGAGFKVSRRVELLPEFSFRTRLGSLYRNDYPVNLHQYQWGVKFGLNYYF